MRKTNHDRALESESKVGERRAEILRRLRELGWKDGEFEMGYNTEWDALVNQPRPLTDRVWTNLLPKLTPLLEAKRASIELTAKQERRTTRIDRLTTLLQAFMIKAHPLASLVEALGFNPELRGTDSNEVSQHVVNFLENCPFPDVQTVSKWSWIADTIETEVTLQEIDNLFCANLVDIDDRAFHWRRDIEKQLLIPILSERTQSNELDPDDLNSEVIFKLTVKGSAPPLKMIGPLTRFLLRADTIFRQIREDPKINEDFVYYPYLTSTFGSYYWVDDELLKVTPSSYHRHELAEKVSRALLKGIEMVDASHLELAVMGDVFVCGRCRLQKAKSWQGMVQHYLDELRSWSVSLLVYPRFKTRHPTGYYNAHSITCSIDNSPLTRVATDQEVTEMNMESAQLDNPISCIPCKNYARMYVSTNMEAMECHLERAHLLSLPVAEGVHYEPVTGSTNFLQGGGEWKVRWDAYYDEHAD